MKDFFKLKEAITSADKKPENYVDPRSGKTKTRMVPTMKMAEQNSQVTVGDYTTKHFDICPSAVKLYSSISGKTQMTHLIVETMMLQDLLFRLEKQLIAQGSADEEDVEKAEHFGDMIMDNAEQMDLVDEHSYIDDVHLAKIRQLAGEEEEEDEDEEDMNEKTLTPAELKKREEIAKAIKRENPNMPMAKKMAIATATAKKVAEEVEQIDEYNTKSSKAIVTKDDKPVAIYPDLKSAQKDYYGKDDHSIGMRSHSAAERIRKANPGIKIVESVEQIDEISTDLAHDVYKKRMAQAQSLGKQSGDEPDIKKANVLARAGHKAEKKAGETHLRMIKKILRREEVELDEISQPAKDRYIRRAVSDFSHASAVRKDAQSTGNTDLAAKMKARMKKRNQGMTRAFGGEKD